MLAGSLTALIPRLRTNGAIEAFVPAPVFLKTPDSQVFTSPIPAPPLRPLLFGMGFAKLGTNSGAPFPVKAFGRIPTPATKLYISGITRDSGGTALGSCVVKLYRTADDVLIEQQTSDATTGAYAFGSVGLGEAYYIVAYKSGALDVAGTTVNTLVGT